MSWLEIVFWLCGVCVGYVYVGYPLALALVTRLRRFPSRRQPHCAGSVSVVICAHNEQDRIGQRIAEFTALLNASGVYGEIIVVSDGSTDGTVERVRAYTGANVRVLEFPDRVGKAAALSAGCEVASGEILVFADCRQHWDSNAVRRLLDSFGDATVGAVSGDLVLEAATGVLAGVGLYWRYEKWLRKKESLFHSTVGVTGAICAVRRCLFQAIPAGTILDDVYWPMCVTLAGHRVIHEEGAIAFDRLPHKAGDEFRRKVRTLAGNFQLVVRLPQTLLPWRNPVWLQFVSHKLLRLAVPWAMLGMLVTSALLGGKEFGTLFWAQIAFYGLALIGNVGWVARQLRPAAAAASVVVLNAAAWVAFWVWVSGRSGHTWHKSNYRGIKRPVESPSDTTPASVAGPP
jgi:poly-beta-1,6-N-acetyl-D-glucosamine synthase